MGQEEVLEVLKNSKDVLSLREIANMLNQPTTKISMILAKLVKHGEVEEIVLHRALAMKFYECKQPIRLFRCLF
jgi:DNA-binding IclR family transcriptional regulator